MKASSLVSETARDQQSLDCKLIDINDRTEILIWSFVLKVSPVELKQAIAKVGPSATKVREHFGLSSY